jgi:hypothetical protein
MFASVALLLIGFPHKWWLTTSAARRRGHSDWGRWDKKDIFKKWAQLFNQFWLAIMYICIYCRYFFYFFKNFYFLPQPGYDLTTSNPQDEFYFWFIATKTQRFVKNIQAWLAN